MHSLTPSERVLRARLAAHTLHATHDPRETTRVARAALRARFEREVDPDGTLPEAERRRRAEHARKAHYTRMALASAKARASRRGRPRTPGKPTLSDTLGARDTSRGSLNAAADSRILPEPHE